MLMLFVIQQCGGPLFDVAATVIKWAITPCSEWCKEYVTAELTRLIAIICVQNSFLRKLHAVASARFFFFKIIQKDYKNMDFVLWVAIESLLYI